MNLLEVRDLSVHFGGLRAVDELSFSVAAGRIKGIIGPNGAGKTTLFNALAGLVALTRGDIVFDGESIVGLRSFQRAERGIARTFQNLQIFRELSLLENVMIGRHPRTRAGFFASLAGLPSVRREETDIEARAYDKLALLGLADRADSSAAGLSFGEAKLLEIARALVAEPRLLLLDEPAAGVPHGEQAALSAIIRRVNDSGVTVLLVEHNMRMVMNLCHEVLVLNYGRHLAEGPPAEVSRNRDVIVAYLGEEAVHA
ncbi:MAG: ABC transporter ATP-binding protein [Burkholderiales bacterium]|nr:ABC transporter ATP-binding protein [Burkholderiales bacterium]